MTYRDATHLKKKLYVAYLAEFLDMMVGSILLEEYWLAEVYSTWKPLTQNNKSSDRSMEV